MPPKDPIDEADEETFPASDAPAFSGTHARPPAEHGLPRILIDVSPGSTDEGYFRAALARFDGRVAVTYGHGDAFERALPEAEVVVAERARGY